MQGKGKIEPYSVCKILRYRVILSVYTARGQALERQTMRKRRKTASKEIKKEQIKPQRCLGRKQGKIPRQANNPPAMYRPTHYRYSVSVHGQDNTSLACNGCLWVSCAQLLRPRIRARVSYLCTPYTYSTTYSNT